MLPHGILTRQIARNTVLSPLAVLSLRGALAAGIVAVGIVAAGIAAAGILAAPAGSALTAKECDRLFRHQLDLYVAVQSPLHPALRDARTRVENREARRAQQAHCLARTSRAAYECQMRASDLAELLRCDASLPGSKKGTDPKGDPPVEPPTKTETTKRASRTMVTKVEDSTCARAYERMLELHLASADFQKRPDSARLLEHWRSDGARESFRRRCRRAFSPRDLNCILSAKDTVVLQSCLLETGS